MFSEGKISRCYTRYDEAHIHGSTDASTYLT
jgi:hypothetical protein